MERLEGAASNGGIVLTTAIIYNLWIQKEGSTAACGARERRAEEP
jgi:hypothetical protein